jgi:ATP-dependent protease ClpP protease subunit
MRKFGVTATPQKSADDSGYEDANAFRVSYVPANAGVYNIFLYGPILDASQFVDAIQAMSVASEIDVVQIHLSTPGGSLDATDTFIHAMRECSARIIVKASGGVHSAGSVILLNADEFTLSENFNCLIHNGSVGPAGKFSDWRAETKHTDAYMERVMRSTYEGFLSEEELDNLLAGKDIWLDAESFVARWEARNAAYEAAIEASEDE